MFFIFYLFIFLLGLSVGSFLNVVILRLQKEEKLTGRSYCPHCKHMLAWTDLIPVASFLWLGGKCRYCHKKISGQYPLVEISTAAVFLLIANQVGIFDLTRLFFLWYIASVLIVIFVYDLKHYIIPDKILFPAIIITFAYHLVFNFYALFSHFLWAGLLASGFFASIYFISKGAWMGFGDVKLAVLLGLLLGFPNILLGLFLAFFFGAIIGMGAIFLNPSTGSGQVKIGLKSEMPFAPFLILGTFIAMLWGEEIIGWYLHFLII
ncbi:MAG: prepilin peptidase [bacterium]|nr:prepilin peptidase [bacterium]